MIANLLLSQGVTMILHDDEVGRTQNGNNNTHCQDNETSSRRNAGLGPSLGSRSTQSFGVSASDVPSTGRRPGSGAFDPDRPKLPD